LNVESNHRTELSVTASLFAIRPARALMKDRLHSPCVMDRRQVEICWPAARCAVGLIPSPITPAMLR